MRSVSAPMAISGRSEPAPTLRKSTDVALVRPLGGQNSYTTSLIRRWQEQDRVRAGTIDACR